MKLGRPGRNAQPSWTWGAREPGHDSDWGVSPHTSYNGLRGLSFTSVSSYMTKEWDSPPQYPTRWERTLACQRVQQLLLPKCLRNPPGHWGEVLLWPPREWLTQFTVTHSQHRKQHFPSNSPKCIVKSKVNIIQIHVWMEQIPCLHEIGRSKVYGNNIFIHNRYKSALKIIMLYKSENIIIHTNRKSITENNYLDSHNYTRHLNISRQSNLTLSLTLPTPLLSFFHIALIT